MRAVFLIAVIFLIGCQATGEASRIMQCSDSEIRCEGIEGWKGNFDCCTPEQDCLHYGDGFPWCAERCPEFTCDGEGDFKGIRKCCSTGCVEGLPECI